MDCGRGDVDDGKVTAEQRHMWGNDSNATSCFDITNGSFTYGIYQQAVSLTTQHSAVQRYIYALFWGFQVILHMLYLN